ncbi:MAG: hypothetical protein WC364_05315 [Eubacteriales bacterium]
MAYRGILPPRLVQEIDFHFAKQYQRGLYRWVDMKNNAGSSLLDVAIAIPNGVICLLSALAYHNLTTHNPWEVSVAVSRKSRVKNDVRVY